MGARRQTREASQAQNLATFDGSNLTVFREAYWNIASNLFRILVSRSEAIELMEAELEEGSSPASADTLQRRIDCLNTDLNEVGRKRDEARARAIMRVFETQQAIPKALQSERQREASSDIRVAKLWLWEKKQIAVAFDAEELCRLAMADSLLTRPNSSLMNGIILEYCHYWYLRSNPKPRQRMRARM